MDRETYEKQKPFAGEKKPSMLRRCVGHDYTSRQMYMVTMVTKGRRPLFGKVVGSCNAETGSADAPHIVLSELGQRVADEWWATSSHHPEIKVMAVDMNTDDVRVDVLYELYDIETTPLIYVLDRDKRIIAKKIRAKQIPLVL